MNKMNVVRFLIDVGADLNTPDKTHRFVGYILWYKVGCSCASRTAADRIWAKILGKGDTVAAERFYIELFSSESRMEQLQKRNFSHLHNIVLEQVPGDLDLELKMPSGANEINSVDAEGTTPLIWAARRGDIAVVDKLIRYGADVTIASNIGATALYYAALAQSSEAPATIRSLLRAGAPVDARNFRLQTPLMMCVHYHDDPENFIRPLIENDPPADVNACERRGISVIDGAVLTDHVRNVAYLLEVGAILDRPDQDKLTGVYAAVVYNSHKVLKLLMERGADVSTVSKDDKTLLHLASANADCETLDILTAYGLDIDREAQDSSGYTAEEIFANREDKDNALMESFDRFLESLGSGSIVFAEIEEKEAIMNRDMLGGRDCDSPFEDYVDAAEDWLDANLPGVAPMC